MDIREFQKLETGDRIALKRRRDEPRRVVVVSGPLYDGEHFKRMVPAIDIETGEEHGIFFRDIIEVVE